MNTLHKAYQVLGLDAGAAFEVVKRRFKQLVIVWHPDRMANDHGRREAEEELKKINNSFDVLKKHFESEHKSGSACGCQAQSQTSSAGHQSSGTSGRQSTKNRSTNEQWRKEHDANRREEQRRREAEDEARQSEAARKAEEQWRAHDTAKRATEAAMRQEQSAQDEKLRWQLAVAAGGACVLILGFGWVGVGIREFVGDVKHYFENFQTTPQLLPANSQGTTTQPSSDQDLSGIYVKAN